MTLGRWLSLPEPQLQHLYKGGKITSSKDFGLSFLICKIELVFSAPRGESKESTWNLCLAQIRSSTLGDHQPLWAVRRPEAAVKFWVLEKWQIRGLPLTQPELEDSFWNVGVIPLSFQEGR